ncbi:hypothetical protein [Carnobacterium jeotgali]|uniref:hypothetical protein n=1 Tax=Carnobacterium jeotgali TaxID=545534 RepID=UPI0038909662
MNWAGITLIVIYSLSLGISLTQHGKQREDKHNFWTSLISTLIVLFLIYKTGAFN